jgi:NADPH-dependent glutamate synthase beta subunit-like oxidoreductase
MAYKNIQDPRNKAAKLKHYYANKEQYFERNKKAKQAMREYTRQLREVPCLDCGIQYPYYCMDFDHVNSEDKIDCIGRIINKGSWKQLQLEIEKCEIVCAICHRKRTHNRSQSDVV